MGDDAMNSERWMYEAMLRLDEPRWGQTDTCEQCGATLHIGDHPFCPHGRGSGIPIRDEIPGGQFFENGFSTPQKFYSHSGHRKALDKEGLQIAPRWVPGSKHLTRWCGPSAKSLEDAKILLSRGSAPRHRDTEGPGGLKLLPQEPLVPIEVTDAGWSIKPSEVSR
jgi:hypothetical protein